MAGTLRVGERVTITIIPTATTTGSQLNAAAAPSSPPTFTD